MIKTIEDLFKDKKFFQQALTHRSWVNENKGQRGSNERLEFLGDAVLELIVTDYIYKLLPEKEEGYLTALRANVVNTVNLSKIAKKFDIGKNIYFSKGEKDAGGTSDSVLADTLEAIIGAIYLDSGIEKARDFISHNLLFDIDEKITEPLKDAKSSLQEQVQAEGHPAPKYKVVKKTGPDHDRVFTVEVWIDNKVMGSGEGKNKMQAEQMAARVALEARK